MGSCHGDSSSISHVITKFTFVFFVSGMKYWEGWSKSAALEMSFLSWEYLVWDSTVWSMMRRLLDLSAVVRITSCEDHCDEIKWVIMAEPHYVWMNIFKKQFQYNLINNWTNMCVQRTRTKQLHAPLTTTLGHPKSTQCNLVVMIIDYASNCIEFNGVDKHGK